MVYCEKKRIRLAQILLTAVFCILTAFCAKRPDAVLQQALFDEWTDALFEEYVTQDMLNLHYILADPAGFGIGGAKEAFAELSAKSSREEAEKAEETASKLKEFSRKALREDQKITFDILDYMVKVNRDFIGMELYQEPLSATIGTQAELPMLLSEYQFYDRSDVDEYLYLLSQLDSFYGSILAFEQAKSEAGLFMSDTAAEAVIESCEAYLMSPEQGVMVTAFDERIDALRELTGAEKEQYKEENLKMVREHFAPAYRTLAEGVEALKGTGVNDQGLCYFPKGKKYYEFLVRSSVAPSYSSIEKMADGIERQTERDAEKMYAMLEENPNLLEQVDRYAFLSEEPGTILDQLQEQIEQDFPALTQSGYQIKYVPEALEDSLSPAFYLVPPIDRYHENRIYINGKKENQNMYTMLAHEGYPGHLYQTVYFAEHNTCKLRSVLSFRSYSEGWATYVEHLAYRFDNGLEEGIGELLMYNSRISLSIYALLDIRVNYNGWTREQAGEYLGKYYSASGTIVDEVYDALVANPTNYLSYYFGSLEITNMRAIAEEKLGERFDAKEFHRFLLETGPAPFCLIRDTFGEWLETEKKAA